MKTITLVLFSICFFVSCQYDDTAIWNEVRNHENRIAKLEVLCNQMNTNVLSLQNIVEALHDNDYVTNVSSVLENGEEVGYTISFSKSGSITIYHGADGKDGQDGDDGKDGVDGQDGADGKDGQAGVDGKDGYTPVIGVKKGNDGIYYWTLDGQWLINDDGDMIPVTGRAGTDGINGTDGTDGTDGKDGIDGKDGADGITPKLKIEDGYWYVSYDNGVTFTMLGEAKGDKGDSFFKEVFMEDNFLVIKLMDGSSFKLPYFNGIVPKLLSFTLQSRYNPLWISSDVKCEFLSNNILECHIPNFVENKEFIPTFEFDGEQLLIDNIEVISGETKVNFSKPVIIKILGSGGQSVEYTLNVRAFTGLPIVKITTKDFKTVNSKDTYLDATFTLTEDVITRSAGDSWSSKVKIKGRGNSTWDLPKKPYKIKFDEKVSILGEPKAKSWLLLANHTDKSLIRNATAFYMGYNSNLPYTTRYHFVELFLNDVYMGSYQLCEDKDVGKNRIDLSDNGYLLEIDAKAAEDDITFNISSIAQPINIKEPEIEVGSEAYNFIKNYLTEVESVLYGENFANLEIGYAKYLDIDTFVDWYLINEITKNNNAVFFTSCYMTYEPGEKLCMGPLWDFDIAFGNCYYNNNNNPKEFWIKTASWYSRLFQDPNFVKKVKERFNHFYSIKDDIYTEINVNAEYLKYSIAENDAKWNVLYQWAWPNHGIWGSYNNEVQAMKKWLETRMNWLKVEFEKM